METTINEIETYNDLYDTLALHPLQSWEWGEFRKKTGTEIYRFGEYHNGKLIHIFQLTLHKIPKTNFFVGYIPKSAIPSGTLLLFLTDFFKNKKLIFIKFEPAVETTEKHIDKDLEVGRYILNLSPRPLFTKYTFQIDLTKSEETLLKEMKPKTRYNVRLADKKGVTVEEDNSNESFETYLKLQKETTKRQGFYAHNEKYHRLLWETLKPAQIARILTAKYNNEVLVSWMVFLFNNVLYYPYGGSSDKYRKLMPSNLMLFKASLWGKENGAKTFDLWGALGENPDPKDSWIGFHKFKEGYSPKHVEFIGSFDFVLNPFMYSIYNFVDNLRWKILHLIK